MSLGKLKKQVEKYEAMLPECERDGPKKTFIITDSKGSYLNRFLRRRDYIQIVWKSGARVGELDLLSRLQNKLKDTEQPIVLIWLGTCDFTKKNRNRGISLRRVCADDVMAECAVMREFLDLITLRKYFFCTVLFIPFINGMHLKVATIYLMNHKIQH